MGRGMFGVSKKRQQGWLALCVRPDRFDLAHVGLSSGKPRLARMESYARAGDDVAALKTLKQQKGLGGFRCTTLLAADEYQMLTVEAPDVAEEELREALRWQMRESLAFPAESATFDLLRLPVASASGRASLLVAAASNPVLTPKITLFDRAGLDLQAIDIPEMAQRNVAALFEDENRGLAMLTQCAEGGLLTLTYRGELCVSRRIEIGVRQVLEADEERRAGLFERIALELQRSLDNFERQYTAVSVSKIVIGPSAASDLLLAGLQDLVYVPLERGDLTAVIDCSAVPELRDFALQGERLLLIGAALRMGDGGAA